MSKESQELLRRIANERNIAIEILEDALEAALVSASKKMLDPEMEVTRAATDPETGDYRVYAEKIVVEEVENEAREISLPEARMFDLSAKLEDTVEIDVTPHDFGRIAAQNAKQVVTQRIREAEREMVYERYCNKIGELVSGTVQQTERGNVIVDIGYAEAYLPFSEQPRGERYHYGDRVRAVITEVSQTHRDAQVLLSRKSPELVKKLFEQEVTEVRDGTVVIKGVAREPGKRSKIAVMSTNLDVDPVGACVGMKGSRVQMVVQELKGERIDIIPYSNDKAKFVQNSLKPAEVESVDLNEAEGVASLIVREDQLSLAIGKGGLNVKLASELTGLQLDVISLADIESSERETREMLFSLPGANDELVETLMSGGVFSYEDILEYEVEGLTETLKLDKAVAETIFEAASQFVSGEKTPAYLLEEEEPSDEEAEGESESAEASAVEESEPESKEASEESSSEEATSEEAKPKEDSANQEETEEQASVG